MKISRLRIKKKLFLTAHLIRNASALLLRETRTPYIRSWYQNGTCTTIFVGASCILWIFRYKNTQAAVTLLSLTSTTSGYNISSVWFLSNRDFDMGGRGLFEGDYFQRSVYFTTRNCEKKDSMIYTIHASV